LLPVLPLIPAGCIWAVCGTALRARQVADTLAHKITGMNPGQGFAANKAELGKAGITPDKNIICYCGTSREGSLIYFTLKHVLGYPNVRLYEGSWKEYVWLNGRTLHAATGGSAAGT
jgi:3-mercaptopyruvate sulfurtransferase SseA